MHISTQTIRGNIQSPHELSDVRNFISDVVFTFGATGETHFSAEHEALYAMEKRLACHFENVAATYGLGSRTFLVASSLLSA